MASCDSGKELSSSVDWYFSRKANAHKLLTAEEEIALAREIRAGSEKAKKTLIESNLRLVVSFAKRYQSCDVPLSDLIQEGNIGLVEAAGKFDDRKRCRFSTYATYWIHQRIQRAVRQQSRVIGFSENTFKQLLEFGKILDDLSQKFGRTPTFTELALAMGLIEQKVEKLAQYHNSLVDILSLDQVYEQEAEPSSSDPCQMVIDRDDLRQIIKTFSAVLTVRERFVIEEHFGLNNGIPQNLKCVGKMLNITRERTRQIEERAFEKIRHRITLVHLGY